MKAIQYKELGPPSVLSIQNVDTPQVGSCNVLIKLKFAGINHTDIHFRKGLPGVKSRLPHTPGCDGSGIVQELGSEVKDIHVGDHVCINPTIYCEICEFCQRGDAFLCKHQNLVGRESNGTYAQYISVNQKNIYVLPPDFDLKLAAAAPLVYHTAYAMAVTHGQIQKGHTVLIMGAGSGVSSAAIQLAKLQGAMVITTASSKEKCDKALKLLKADHVIQYTQESIKDRVKAITKKQGVDVILDHVGGDTFKSLIQSLKNGGRLVTCGATAGYEPTLDLRHVFFRQLHIIGSTMGSKKDFQDVMNLVTQGKLTPIIDTVFPLASASLAHQKIEARDVFGKILLEI